MIYNRTYTDIINAKKLFANKIQKFIELTADEQSTIDKAYFNLTAINRITSKINDIWHQIVGYGGEKIEIQDVREWGEQEFFNIANFTNIRQNIADIILQLSALEFIDTTDYQIAYDKLTDDYIYTNLNNLEKLLFDIYDILVRFVIDRGTELYILGAYNVIESEGELTLE